MEEIIERLRVAALARHSAKAALDEAETEFQSALQAYAELQKDS